MPSLLIIIRIFPTIICKIKDTNLKIKLFYKVHQSISRYINVLPLTVVPLARNTLNNPWDTLNNNLFYP